MSSVAPPPTRPEPASPSPFARAVRAFGDDYPPVRRQWITRGLGLLFVLVTAIYVPWLLGNLNDGARSLSWPYAVASLLTIFATLLNIANQWTRAVPEPHHVPEGAEPKVGVLIPTCGEPIPVVLRTVASVFDQDWPCDRLVVIVSDDGTTRSCARRSSPTPCSTTSRRTAGRPAATTSWPRRVSCAHKVTRRTDDVRWHWAATLPHATVALVVLVVLVYALRIGTLPHWTPLLGAACWGRVNVVLLVSFIARGWCGVRLLHRWARHTMRGSLSPAAPTPSSSAMTPAR